MSEICCTRLAKNTGRKKIAILAPSHNFVGLYLRSYGMYRQLEKKLVKRRYRLQMSFGLLMAEVCWRVWDGFRVLAALLHGI